jgi:hypothetical protein
VKWELVGEIEVLGESLSQYHFVHNKFNVTQPGVKSGPSGLPNIMEIMLVKE